MQDALQSHCDSTLKALTDKSQMEQALLEMERRLAAVSAEINLLFQILVLNFLPLFQNINWILNCLRTVYYKVDCSCYNDKGRKKKIKERWKKELVDVRDKRMNCQRPHGQVWFLQREIQTADLWVHTKLKGSNWHTVPKSFSFEYYYRTF